MFDPRHHIRDRAQARWRFRPLLPPIMVLCVALLLEAPAMAQAAATRLPVAPPGAHIEELLALVRQLNPDLAAAALESQAAAAKIVPAGALDEPMLNLTRDQGFRETLVSISQEFPLWGKRELRTHVAEANATAATARESGVAQDLEERVKVAFAQYYEADQAARVTRDIHKLLHAVSGTARARYAQGLVNQSDAIRAELDQARLDTELSALEEAKQTAMARINALIARRADAALAQPLALRKIPPATTLILDDLAARARENNPSLAAYRAEVVAAAGERALVDKSYYPDVTVSVGAEDMPNQSIQPMVGVGIKIPLQWGVRRAQTRAANAKTGAAQLHIDGAMLQIESDLKSALAKLRRAEDTEELIKTALNPQSDAAYRSALSSYQLGRGDLTPVLEAAHHRLEIRLEFLRVQTAQQAAFAAIERLIGGDL